jgi:hypothetical protein
MVEEQTGHLNGPRRRRTKPNIPRKEKTMFRKSLFALVVLLGSVDWAQAQYYTMQATPPAYLSGQWYSTGNARFPTYVQASPFMGVASPYPYGWGGRVLLTGYGLTPDNYGRMYYSYPYSYYPYSYYPYSYYPVYPRYGWPGGQ